MRLQLSFRCVSVWVDHMLEEYKYRDVRPDRCLAHWHSAILIISLPSWRQCFLWESTGNSTSAIGDKPYPFCSWHHVLQAIAVRIP